MMSIQSETNGGVKEITDFFSIAGTRQLNYVSIKIMGVWHRYMSKGLYTDISDTQTEMQYFFISCKQSTDQSWCKTTWRRMIKMQRPDSIHKSHKTNSQPGDLTTKMSDYDIAQNNKFSQTH